MLIFHLNLHSWIKLLLGSIYHETSESLHNLYLSIATIRIFKYFLSIFLLFTFSRCSHPLSSSLHTCGLNSCPQENHGRVVYFVFVKLSIQRCITLVDVLSGPGTSHNLVLKFSSFEGQSLNFYLVIRKKKSPTGMNSDRQHKKKHAVTDSSLNYYYILFYFIKSKSPLCKMTSLPSC